MCVVYFSWTAMRMPADLEFLLVVNSLYPGKYLGSHGALLFRGFRWVSVRTKIAGWFVWMKFRMRGSFVLRPLIFHVIICKSVSIVFIASLVFVGWRSGGTWR